MPQIKAAPRSGDVELLRDATKNVIKNVVKDLKESSPVSADSKLVLFPNGIELIDVSFSFGLEKAGIEVKVKIAGPKA